jgi:hypothetical protein
LKVFFMEMITIMNVYVLFLGDVGEIDPV